MYCYVFSFVTKAHLFKFFGICVLFFFVYCLSFYVCCFFIIAFVCVIGSGSKLFFSVLIVDSGLDFSDLEKCILFMIV